jgi:hypothetical protein
MDVIQEMVRGTSGLDQKEGCMGKLLHTAEQAVGKPRKAVVLQSEGMPLEEGVRQMWTSDARSLWMLNIVDDYSLKCLKTYTDPQVKAADAVCIPGFRLCSFQVLVAESILPVSSGSRYCHPNNVPPAHRTEHKAHRGDP